MRLVVFFLSLLIVAGCGGGGGGGGSSTYTVTVNVTGITGGELTISSGFTTKVISQDGIFSLNLALSSGDNYNISLASSSGHQCTVAEGAAGTVENTNISLSITCTLSLPNTPVLASAASDTAIAFSWAPTTSAAFYRLLENADGSSGFSQKGSDITTLSYRLEVSIYRFDWLNASYMLQACNALGCSDSLAIQVDGLELDSIAYLKAPIVSNDDRVGFSVSFSKDGNILAVGASGDDSNSAGINGDESNDLSTNSGAVHIFEKNNGVWFRKTYIKSPTAGGSDSFGYSVSLSGDGNYLAVGAALEDSNATGLNGDQSDDSSNNSGAAYIFAKNTDGNWVYTDYVKASNTSDGDQFGAIVRLDNDGDTLAVTSLFEDSNAVGINGDGTDNSSTTSGAAYVFSRTGTVWSEQAYIKASNSASNDWFGFSMDLSGNGDHMIVGAVFESSNAVGVGGDETNNGASDSGAAYVFSRTAGNWSQQAYLKASNTESFDNFARSVSINDDGSVAASGARREDSNATNVGGNEANNSADASGAVYIFTRSGISWSQQAYIKASNTEADDQFGFTIALNNDGTLLAVSAYEEDSDSDGIANNDPTDNTASNSGAVYLYEFTGGTWAPLAYIKSANSDSDDEFGYSLSFSDDGKLAISAVHEDASAIVGSKNYNDNTASNTGAVYLY
jgi:trimeric autotransporter adhesin